MSRKKIKTHFCHNNKLSITSTASEKFSTTLKGAGFIFFSSPSLYFPADSKIKTTTIDETSERLKTNYGTECP